MTGYKILMRVFLRENFSLKRMLGVSASKSKAKMVMIALVIVYAIAVFFFSFGFMFYELGKFFASINMTEMILMYMFSYIAGFAIMISSLRADGYLFHFKDYDVLAPLPIKPVEVIFAKATVMLLNMYLIAFIFSLPMMFFYVYFTPISVMTIPYLLLAFIAAPLPMIMVASLLSMVIARITVRLKHSNIIKIILMFVLFFGIMGVSFSFSFSNLENPLLSQQDFIRSLGAIYLPMQWFIEAVHESNLISLILLLVTHIGLFTGFIVLISKASMSINSKKGVNVGLANKEPAVSRSSSVFKSLLKKELRMYLGITFYVVNTAIGIVMMLIAGIASLFFKNEVADFLNQAAGVNLALEPLLMVFIGFSMSTIYTSAVSLSVEGKKFAFLKSLPLKAKTIMDAKLVFNILLGLPVAILTLVLFTVAFELPFINLILMILVAASFSILISAFGSLVNLYMPKFDFVSEVEVVKQSMSALIAIFGGFGFIAINGFIYYFLSKETSFVFGLTSMMFANLILASGFYLWMTRKCESLFIKMSVQ